MENSKRIPVLIVAATILFIALFAFGNNDSKDNLSKSRRLQGIADLKDPRTIEIKSVTRSLVEEANETPATSAEQVKETPGMPAVVVKNTPALPVEEANETRVTPAEEVKETPAEPVAEVQETPVTPVEEVKETPAEPVAEVQETLAAPAAEGASLMPFNLPKSAEDWCAPPTLPPLPYDHCKDKQDIIKVVDSLPMLGGLTNSLKVLLLGAILSFEQGKCFFVDETTSALPLRKDPANTFPTTFLDRYFERIGLPLNDPIVAEARKSGNIKAVDWEEPWDWEHNRRIMSQRDTIPVLGFEKVPGHGLKRNVLKRMWRPLPHVRETGCKKLEQHVGPEDFMSFSVRRGDKHSVEHFEYATVDQYLVAAERAKDTQFDGKMPIIFVATDDCSVMPEFREKRPDWRFVSECDNEVKKDDGFRLTDMADWNHEETDAHFGKFFVELYALAASKYFIGVIYTNVTWWALFMRSQPIDTFQILKTAGTERSESIELW
eukprot:CAMPEP_0194205994 /NCGR_PEP_ID=MMETSP0156-20130528/5133_1 /TAXON_ID=33649 /ORGANISM="Thalassionema nitzschioides, Strain L26-B" /LENGTH=491 /DNA_ID=CAMNT_0038932409 /DNA_START=68 /DNA_END=1540 /DNA_ORIENTATION=-